MNVRGTAYYENLAVSTATTESDDVDALWDATAIYKPGGKKVTELKDYYLSRVPVDWLRRVFELGSTDACKVAGMLLLERSFNLGTNVIKGTEKGSELFGLNRQARYRGTKKLADAGLLRIVDRSPGRYVTVELLGIK